MRKVVNVSSTAGVNGNAGQANYSTAKSGILGLSKTMSKEWGRYNVCVNAVAYAWIETRLTIEKDGGGSVKIGDIEVPAGIPKANQEAIKATIPLGRPGTANDGRKDHIVSRIAFVRLRVGAGAYRIRRPLAADPAGRGAFGRRAGGKNRRPGGGYPHFIYNGGPLVAG